MEESCVLGTKGFLRLAAGDETDVWTWVGSCARFLLARNWQLDTCDQEGMIEYKVMASRPEPPVAAFLRQVTTAKDELGDACWGFGYAVPWAELESFGKLAAQAAPGAGHVTAGFRFPRTGARLIFEVRRVFPSLSSYVLGMNDRGMVSGGEVSVLPALYPGSITVETLPGCLEVYEVLKALTHELALAEFLGSYNWPGYQMGGETVNWQDYSGWSYMTLCRFGPGIVNRLIIPLEEHRLPTPAEAADDRLDGDALWCRDVP